MKTLRPNLRVRITSMSASAALALAGLVALAAPAAAAPVPVAVTGELGEAPAHQIVTFENWGGGSTSVIAWADAEVPGGGTPGGLKLFKTVKKTGDAPWMGTTILKTNCQPLISVGNTQVSVKVYSPVAGATIKLKLENAANGAVYVEADKASAIGWQVLTYDFGVPANVAAGAFTAAGLYDTATIFFDFGRGNGGWIGELPSDETFYWDDLTFSSSRTAAVPAAVAQVLVNGESGDASGYSLTAFGDGSQSATSEAQGTAPWGGSVNSGTVFRFTKTTDSYFWAGATFLSARCRPLISSGNTTVTMNVYSPVAGAVIKLKLEHGPWSVEDDQTAVLGWQRMTFDLNKPGFNDAIVYDTASLFFDFGRGLGYPDAPLGPLATSETFYFDDVAFSGATTADVLPIAPSTTPWAVTVPSGAVYGDDRKTAIVYQTVSDLGYVRLTAIGDQSEAGAGKKPWLKVSDGKIQAHAEPEGLTATLSSDSTQLVYDSAALTSTTVDVSASKTGTIVVTMGYQTDNAGQVTETTQQTFKLIIKAATPTSFDRATVSDMTAVDFVDTELDQKPSLVGDLLYAEALPAGSTGNVTPSQGGSFTIRQWTSNGLAVETLKSKSVQVAVSGPGALWDGVSAKDYISFMNWQAGTFPQGGQTVYILNDGRAGTATITVSIDGTVVDTKQIVFQPPVATIDVTVGLANPAALDQEKLPAGHFADAAVTGFLASGDGKSNAVGLWSAQNSQNDHLASIVAKDANGKLNVAEEIACSVSDAAVADWGCWTYVYKGTRFIGSHFAKSGPVTFTLKRLDGTELGSAKFDAVVPNISSISVATDKATYKVGEKVKLVFTAKDAAGNPTTPGLYRIIDTWDIPVGLSTELTQDVTFGVGEGSVVFYAPDTSGKVTMSLTLNAYPVLGASVRKLTLPFTFSVERNSQVTASVQALEAALATLRLSIASMTESLNSQIKRLSTSLTKVLAALK